MGSVPGGGDGDTGALAGDLDWRGNFGQASSVALGFKPPPESAGGGLCLDVCLSSLATERSFFPQ